ncbi:MAG: hypothetical protein M3R30_03340 [Candidatus Eremiobacteraeota bacterium]|nr:hypothetical protein [Candidatus Eremiobacteraeota bacterium]
MLRYFAIASVLVVGTFVGVAAWWLSQPHRDVTIKSVPVTMAPRPAPPGGRTGLGTSGFLADAPWALSTLPECLTQVSVARGPIAFVRSTLPAGAEAIASPATLVYRDCRLSLGDAGVLVRRGPDTLRVPAPVRLYRMGTRLFVLHLEGKRAQLRTYVPSKM